MKKSLALLTALFTVAFLFHSCKKESEPQDSADSYVGIWLANDTLTYPGSTPVYKSYNFSVTKTTPNTVSFTGFSSYSTSVNATVSETAIAFTNGSDIGIVNFLGSKNGSIMTYTYATMNGKSVTGKATKQ